MPTFICPHCKEHLRINAEHVGLRGKCNKCGGKIALIGQAETEAPQMASVLGELPLEPARPARAESEPPTQRQLDYLRDLGMPRAELAGVKTKAEASRLIEAWLPPPSESQRAYLARLGATSEQIAVLRTKAEAADLIQRFLSGI